MKKPGLSRVLLDLIGRLPTLPRAKRSTIGAAGLNFRVRYGNGWDPCAMATQRFDQTDLFGEQAIYDGQLEEDENQSNNLC